MLRWDDISPRESSLYGGTILYIYGEGFGYNLDIVAVTVADYLCVPIDVIDTKITCQIEYTYYTEKVTNMGDGGK